MHKVCCLPNGLSCQYDVCSQYMLVEGAASAHFDAFAPGALRCLRPHGIDCSLLQGLLYRVDCSVSSFFSEWAQEEAAAASRWECDVAQAEADSAWSIPKGWQGSILICSRLKPAALHLLTSKKQRN